ncbi:MAG: hypothetical protein IJP96_04785 [Synergistaceae bacterium]|nr:hypothetical protein [Synergistaceae bacterium]
MEPFVLYNPNDAQTFHSTTCITIQNAQKNGNIKYFVRVPEGKKFFLMSDHTLRQLPECQHCINNKFSGLTGWTGKMPSKFIWAGCFLLYYPDVPAKGFHFMKCKTVRYDEEHNWLGGYRFTSKSWFEDFDGNVINNIQPCPNCISEWDNGNGWKVNFSIDEFFDDCLDYRAKHNEFPPELKELYELMDYDLKNKNKILIGTEIKNNYPNNWDEISRAYRMSREYRCEEKDCGVIMKKYPNLSVAHHINGCHFDVRPKNIKVLCEDCHKKQLYHGNRVNVPNSDLDLLQRLRKEQGIIP